MTSHGYIESAFLKGLNRKSSARRQLEASARHGPQDGDQRIRQPEAPGSMEDCIVQYDMSLRCNGRMLIFKVDENALLVRLCPATLPVSKPRKNRSDDHAVDLEHLPPGRHQQCDGHAGVPRLEALINVWSKKQAQQRLIYQENVDPGKRTASCSRKTRSTSKIWSRSARRSTTSAAKVARQRASASASTAKSASASASRCAPRRCRPALQAQQVLLGDQQRDAAEHRRPDAAWRASPDGPLARAQGDHPQLENTRQWANDLLHQRDLSKGISMSKASSVSIGNTCTRRRSSDRQDADLGSEGPADRGAEQGL